MAPILPSRVTGRFLVLCGECRSPIATEVDAASVDGARAALVARGWREHAAGRKGRTRWVWRCAACDSATDERARVSPGA